MTAAQALARCPDIAVLARDLARESSVHENLLTLAFQLSPDVESTAIGTAILDISSLPSALSEPEKWTTDALTNILAELQLPVRLAIATTPDLSHLAALPKSKLASIYDPSRSSSLNIHPPVSTPESYHSLALESLTTILLTKHSKAQDTILDLIQLFPTWGLRTVGDFVALPRTGLAERMSAHAAIIHDILTARHCRLIRLHRPAKSFIQRVELEFPIESLDPLVFLLRRMLGTLTARLDSIQRVAESLDFTLHFDDATEHQQTITLPEPSGDPDQLLSHLSKHLETLTAPAPVIAVSLDAKPTKRSAKQQQIFERSLKDPHRFAETLNRLDALLGKDRIGTPIPEDTYRPDSFTIHAWRVNESPPTYGGVSGQQSTVKSRKRQATPATAGRSNTKPAALPPCSQGRKTLDEHPSNLHSNRAIFKPPTQSASNPQVADSHHSTPLRRIRPPAEITVITSNDQPSAIVSGPVTGPITEAYGPFPSSGHWWDPSTRWQRVEWDIALQSGPHLRLSNHPPRWHLDGYY